MAKVHFKMDTRAITKLMRSREDLQPILEDYASKAAANTRSIAPTGDDSPHYRDQITHEVKMHRGRYIGRVNANKHTSAWIEFGTGRPGPTPAFAPLRRGVEMLGLKFRKARKKK